MMDVDEIEEWFRCYADDVKTFLVYYLRRTDVDDLVQETFIRAMGGQVQFRRQANPKTWLLAIARNLAVDFVRTQQFSRYIRYSAGRSDVYAAIARGYCFASRPSIGGHAGTDGNP
ncbi:RNA polymerase sigma factor [Alicyclobacillus sp. SO9]|uniref:RNA polymerase sigma factor n=1 Tax=Alicyclobacillus sp. SO9 TaxID=2665646 RepID=UPI0018E7B155|nr:RNA polymerase sigma factor [Alicyclobacillus sp. SO9]QQE79755.1 RNA polymerase sigma factor [Alicyclobacillus sp. SO9]